MTGAGGGAPGSDGGSTPSNYVNPENTNPNAKPTTPLVPVPPFTPNPKFTELLSKEQYEAMFPQRAALFSYEGFSAAAAVFPAFASEGTIEQRKRELVSFLANIAQETTGGWDTAPGGRYNWGLYFTQEVGCEKGICTNYCEKTNTQYPCAPGKTYHGRGPIQLSYNYNYGYAGEQLKRNLLADPDQITRDPQLAFLTGLWFWMTPQSPKPSCHDVMVGKWVPTAQDTAANRVPGFGMTVNIINGGVECNSRSAPMEKVVHRVGHLKKFATIIGVDPGENLYCTTMQSY